MSGDPKQPSMPTTGRAARARRSPIPCRLSALPKMQVKSAVAPSLSIMGYDESASCRSFWRSPPSLTQALTVLSTSFRNSAASSPSSSPALSHCSWLSSHLPACSDASFAATPAPSARSAMPCLRSPDRFAARSSSKGAAPTACPPAHKAHCSSSSLSSLPESVPYALPELGSRYRASAPGSPSPPSTRAMSTALPPAPLWRWVSWSQAWR